MVEFEQFGQKDFGHEQRAPMTQKYRTPGPQAGWRPPRDRPGCKLPSQVLSVHLLEVQASAYDRWIGKQDRTKRLCTKSGH